MKDVEAAGGSEPSMLLKISREKLGLSQGRLGALLGKTHSALSRRESGSISIPEQAICFAQIVIALADHIDPNLMVDVLEAVPHDRRSEPNAILAFASLASRLGKLHIIDDLISTTRHPVSDVIGEGVVVEEDREEYDMTRELKALSHLLEDLRKKLRRRAMQAKSDRAREKFEHASLTMAQTSELVEYGIAEEDSELRKLKDDGGGGG